MLCTSWRNHGQWSTRNFYKAPWPPRMAMNSNRRAAQAFKNSSSLMADIWLTRLGPFKGFLTKLFGWELASKKRMQMVWLIRYGVDAWNAKMGTGEKKLKTEIGSLKGLILRLSVCHALHDVRKQFLGGKKFWTVELRGRSLDLGKYLDWNHWNTPYPWILPMNIKWFERSTHWKDQMINVND